MADNPSITRLLALGPLPPPPSGSNVSFQVFCDCLIDYTPVQSLHVIDSSPKRIKDNTKILTKSNMRQAVRLLRDFWRKTELVDCIIIFGSNQFLLSLMPLLVITARIRGKPCFVRSFGGSLDQFSAKLYPMFRRILFWGFGMADGLLVETQLLYHHFLPLLGEKVHHVTAYRPLPVLPDLESNCKRSCDVVQLEESEITPLSRLRLIFISWVRVEKGVRTLLKAIQLLTPEEQDRVCCDIYGPIVDAYADEFRTELTKTDSVSYKGELKNTEVLRTMQQYDALVFPTFYQGEGYPGVIVESMAVGLPVITTHFRSIPDMVTNRGNGLLVSPEDSFALMEAIQFALYNPDKLRQMGIENKKRQKEYDIRTVLPQMIALMEKVIVASA